MDEHTGAMASRQFMPHAAHSLIASEARGSFPRALVASSLRVAVDPGGRLRGPRRNSQSRLVSGYRENVGRHGKSLRTTLVPVFRARVIVLVILVAASRRGASARCAYRSVVRLTV